MIEVHTAVVGNQQKLCSVHERQALPLAQEAITTVQPPPCTQEYLGNAQDPLLHGRMIHGAQAHPTLFLYLQAPLAHLPIPFIRSGRRGSC